MDQLILLKNRKIPGEQHRAHDPKQKSGKMKKLILFLLACWLTVQSLAQSKTAQNKSLILDQLLRAYEKANLFNGSILVAASDQIIYEKGLGHKSVSAGSLNDINTLYRIYSITKTFTSTVILKLVEQKKLSLEDRLSRFYPSFPKGDSVTIQHLLSHTSGIYDYTRGNDMKDESEDSFIKFLSSRAFDFSPGKGWSYSNSGYWLLGFIISKVTGLTYEEAVKQFIFIPCGMKNSGFDFKTLKHINKATGYEVFAAGVKKESEDIDPPGPYAAGAIYSSVKDMYRYYRAQQSFQLISRTSLLKAWTPDSLNKHYGLGWQVDSFGGKRMVFHGGGGPGFRSNFVMIPEDKVCVFLLTNNENSNLDPLTRMICNVIYDKPYKIPVDVAVDASVLLRYKGYYRMNESLSLQIDLEDSRLIAKANGQGKTNLYAERNNYFYAPDADAYLEFVSIHNDGADTLILYQGSRIVQGKRYIPVWGILGSATDVGWDEKPDLKMLLKPGSKDVWYITDVQFKPGVFKFRFNNDWSMNYGAGDSPGLLKMQGGDISVEPGLYDIELDLSEPQKPLYVLKKK
jgi:CubicO group peptidase (beta-lactamase class C family)